MSGQVNSDASQPATYGDQGGSSSAGLGDFINNLINTYWTQPQQATGQFIGQALGIPPQPPQQQQQFGMAPGQATTGPNAQGAPQQNTLQALLAILGPALAQRAQANQQQRKPGGIGGGGSGAVGAGGQVISAGPQIQGAIP